MNEQNIYTGGLKELFSENIPLIDVRSPGEFAKGSIPNSVTLPILDDEQRHLVGLTYKQEGQQAAITLGRQIVSGANKKLKLEKWIEFSKKNPFSVLVCFRGGLRSRITQQWLKRRLYGR